MDDKIAINKHIVGPYVLTYDASLKTETFSEDCCCGITFYLKDGRYQVVNNYHMGLRLIVNYHNGGWQDIPFKPSSFWVLPSVEVSELAEESFAHVAFTRQ